MLKTGTIVLLALFVLTAGCSVVDLVDPGTILGAANLSIRVAAVIILFAGFSKALVWLLAGLLIPVKALLAERE